MWVSVRVTDDTGLRPLCHSFFLHSVQSLVDKAHSACCSTFPQFPVHKVRSWCLIIFAFPLILLQFYSLMKVDPLCSCAHGHAGLGVMSIKLNGFEKEVWVEVEEVWTSPLRARSRHSAAGRSGDQSLLYLLLMEESVHALHAHSEYQS